MYCIQHCFICRPSDSTVSEDAGVEPRTVATSALEVRRSNHSARSHPQIRTIWLIRIREAQKHTDTDPQHCVRYFNTWRMSRRTVPCQDRRQYRRTVRYRYSYLPSPCPSLSPRRWGWCTWRRRGAPCWPRSGAPPPPPPASQPGTGWRPGPPGQQDGCLDSSDICKGKGSTGFV